MDIRVLDPNPLYLNQTYRLRFRFSNNYPIGFLPPPIPPYLFSPSPIMYPRDQKHGHLRVRQRFSWFSF